MSKKEVERFLIAGGENKDLRLKYNLIESMPNLSLPLLKMVLILTKTS